MNQRMKSALNRPCLRKWDGGAEPQWNGALPGRKRSDLCNTTAALLIPVTDREGRVSNASLDPTVAQIAFHFN